MPKYYYDLHIHSCLSPCGDDAMTPPNIANMAYIKGLDIIALTDHNSARNVAALMRAAQELPLCVIAGIELTTAEEIHMVCLFPDAGSAERAGEELYGRLPKIENKPEFFGHQLVMDEHERQLEELPVLLSNATGLSYEQVPDFVSRFGGFCYPAHIDRDANSVLSNLGMLPGTPVYSALEVYRPARFFSDAANSGYRENFRILTSSDAHQLGDIAEREHFIELEEPSFEALKKALLAQ